MPTLVQTELPESPLRAERPAQPAANLPSRWLARLDAEPMRLAGTVLLYCFPALLFVRAFSIVDPDIWWHLRAGRWALQHHAVPVTDPFSLDGAGRIWVLYSWMFDATMARLFAHFGLTSVAAYEIAVRVALPVLLFHTLRTLLTGFWRPAALTAAAVFSMNGVIGPRPGMITILLVVALFHILSSATRTGRTKLLWLLPPLFVLWANWHIQFVYGLFVLGVFAAEPILNRVFRYHPRQSHTLPASALWIAFGSSALATLLNPYGIRVYATALLYAGQTRVYNIISEFLAMSFRQPEHYVALALALGAAMAIGWRRDPRPLWLILLAVTSVLAFRSVREIWFLAIVSACVIADGWEVPDAPHATRASAISLRRSRALVGIWVVALVLASCRHYGLSNQALEVQVAGDFPEGAAHYIETHHLQGPLLNDLSWGGYLIWRLPGLPVALDGRTNVYGEDRIVQFSKLWKGKPGWNDDPDLRRSNLVLTPSDAAIASLLRNSPDFRIAYEDSQAVVFQRR
jgi:hypothetical protein